MENLSVELNIYKKIFENELTHNILKYWIDHSVQKNGEGLYRAVDLNGFPIENANKSYMLSARILWTFPAGAK